MEKSLESLLFFAWGVEGRGVRREKSESLQQSGHGASYNQLNISMIQQPTLESPEEEPAITTQQCGGWVRVPLCCDVG